MEKDEIRKVTAEMKTVLTDEVTDQVVGGYSKEHWLQMTPEERVAAYKESQKIKQADGNAYCAYFDPNA